MFVKHEQSILRNESSRILLQLGKSAQVLKLWSGDSRGDGSTIAAWTFARWRNACRSHRRQVYWRPLP